MVVISTRVQIYCTILSAYKMVRSSINLILHPSALLSLRFGPRLNQAITCNALLILALTRGLILHGVLIRFCRTIGLKKKWYHGISASRRGRQKKRNKFQKGLKHKSQVDMISFRYHPIRITYRGSKGQFDRICESKLTEFA